MKFVFNLCVYCVLIWTTVIHSITSHLDERIVGGEITNIEEYPYQVSLEYKGEGYCGGSIITDTVILTAAHCLDGKSADMINVRAGTSTRESGGVVASVQKITQHENWDPDCDEVICNDYDVGILELTEPLSLSNEIKTVELPEESESLDVGTEGIVTGFGLLKDQGKSSQDLRKVILSTVDHNECKEKYDKLDVPITDRMFCTSTSNGKKDSCQGDSGGPFVVDNKQFGIISWGYRCATKSFFSVFTNVPVIREWIKSKVNV